jgi:FlaA1/EpsC-like NDP-sugar epimerase
MTILSRLMDSEYFLNHRRAFIVAFHAAVVCLCFVTAFELRFDFALPSDVKLCIARTVGLLLGVKLLVYWRYRLYENWWGNPSFSDLAHIVVANSTASCLFAVTMFFTETMAGMSRSVLVIDAVLAIGVLAGSRFGALWLKQLSTEPRRIERYVLMIGAGEAAVRLLQEIEHNPRLGVCVVGLVDDDRAKWQMRVRGIRVLGGTQEIPELAKKYRVHELIVAIPSASSEDLRRIVRICQSVNVPCKVLPPMAALIEGTIPYRMVRDVKLEDLLARRPVRLRREAVQEHLHGKVVLVTGGAGSIGSELVREISNYGTKQVVVFDRNESGLFMLQMELRATHPELDFAIAVGDIQDRQRLAEVFWRYTPDCVFHAAAFKHVPMMEENPLEAVKNNVLGTWNVLEAARAAHVRDFVFISTDKAIHPSSVMGATKRVAEMILQRHPLSPRCVAVRFGNVLGSAGSVVNVFREQISRGEPITVTHPEVTRYFMTTQEAVQLILQAVTLARGGEIFVLDMGEPVKIVDLAKNMIRLSGLEPDVDISIRFVGMRPGEKLHETLWNEGEQIEKTVFEKIWVLRNQKASDLDVPTLLSELKSVVATGDGNAMLALLRQTVREYEPNPVSTVIDIRSATGKEEKRTDHLTEGGAAPAVGSVN